MFNILMKKALAITAGMLCLISVLNGALVQVQQVSSPAGHLDNTQVVETGTSLQTVQPNLSSNGYFFGYWSNGNNRLADTGGRSVTQATVTISEATTLTAHYFLSTQDSDSDGIMDWYEYRNFGDLNSSSSDDNDGDGFTNQQESELGQESTIRDQVEDGGISSRISGGFVYADTSMVHYTIKSNPIGFISGVDAYVEANASVSTNNLHGQSNGYHFAYWSVNGVRQAGSTGVALSQVSQILSTETAIVAHYIPSTEDTDGDGVMDWFEYNQFGNLSDGPSSDNDGDGFTNQQESELGQEATIPDQVEDGGISSRVSSGFVYADTSMVKYIIKSDPIGFVNTVEGYVEINASVSTGNLHGSSNGYHFGYWTVNGQRKFGPTGVALSQVTASPAVETTMVAHYFPSTQDSDGDGVMDWYEFNQFGDLRFGPTDDIDGDGFSNDQENALGQEATIFDLVEDGGISSRISTSVLYFKQVNQAPHDLVLSNKVVYLNKSASELVGTLVPHDADDPNALRTYGINLTDGNGSTDNHRFTINNRELKSTQIFSSEGNFSIRIRLADDDNASLEKNFTIQAIHDPNKDDDHDGLTYAQEQALGTSDQNPDSDGDGFSDLVESNYGSNPTDANSTANSPPTDLNNSTPASFFENQPIGTLITDFNATDPDVNAALTYSISGSKAHLFNIDQNGTLFTNAIFDFETNASVYNLSVRVTDEYNAFQQISKNIILKDLNESPMLLSLSSNTLLENQPARTVVGEFNATDPDTNATLLFSLVDGNGSSGNAYFTLDSNGTLTSAVIFDYENNESNYSIRVRVADEHNASLEKTFTINLIDQNEQPVITHIGDQILSGALFQDIRINENSGLYIKVNATDPDGDILSFFKTAGGDRALFDVNTTSGLFSYSLPKFDFEDPKDENADNIYIVWIRTIDGKGGYDEKRLRILVNNVIEDNDGDGEEDHYDLDDDNDGFSDAEEMAKGTNPFDRQSVPNAPPSSLLLSNLGFFENLQAGTVIGEFNATDPDANSTLTISFVDGNGSDGHHLFIIDGNHSLRTTRAFDYEKDDRNYSIHVGVADEHNLSMDRVFSISLLNVIEDFDVDGIEDFYDFDDDNDGFPDLYEINYGSNPRDLNSTANLAPNLLNLTRSAVEWNATAGTRVGQFMINDPDVNASLSLQFVDTNDTDYDLFTIDDNYTLITTQTIPYERTLPALLIHVMLSDEWNASLVKTFEIVVTAKPHTIDSNHSINGNTTLYDSNLTTDGTHTFSAWWGVEQPEGQGWVSESWLGTFRPYEQGWLYHLQLGWLYVSPTVDNSLWLWSPDRRWLWTRKDVFPFMYHWEDENWLYFLLRSDGTFHTFNYATDSYE